MVRRALLPIFFLILPGSVPAGAEEAVARDSVQVAVAVPDDDSLAVTPIVMPVLADSASCGAPAADSLLQAPLPFEPVYDF
jgi:hypothetical protein